MSGIIILRQYIGNLEKVSNKIQELVKSWHKTEDAGEFPMKA